MTTSQPRVQRVNRLGWSLVGRMGLTATVGVVTGTVLQRRSEELEPAEGVPVGLRPGQVLSQATHLRRQQIRRRCLHRTCGGVGGVHEG